MWLDRFSSQSTPSASPLPWARSGSPASGRTSLHLNRNVSGLRRPDLPQRVSSLSGLPNGSADNLSQSPREAPRSSLKTQLSSANPAQEPLDALDGLLRNSQDSLVTHEGSTLQKDVELAAKVDFGGLSLHHFAKAGRPAQVEDADIFKVGKESKGFEDLHKSIQACDQILISVEQHLTIFKADLATVAAEIETLQTKSIDLTERLEKRKTVERRLSPEVNRLALSPALVRKITEGNLDDGWVKALQEVEKVSKNLENDPKSDLARKASVEMRPFVANLKDRAVERVRDHVVAQIKALRSPSINAQVLQKNALSKFRDAYAFLAKHQPKLEEEIAQAYINTMKWYYLSNFSRYKTALEKLQLHHFDKTDTIAADDPIKRAAPSPAGKATGPADAFVLGRRVDPLRTLNPQAISSFVAEEDKSAHFLESPFRAFNLALIDNASAEFSFMNEFFSTSSFQTVSKRFLATLEPALTLGQSLTKQLVEASTDSLGILICVRLNQHFAFQLQRRKVSAMEGYTNGTSMLLWPRFQQVMDMHSEALKKTAAGLSGKPAGSALSLTGSTPKTSSSAPQPVTQRFASFVQGILILSKDAGDDEPVQRSLSRLTDDYIALMVKLSKSIADAKKRERFLVNNYSLVGTIIAETEGKMSSELKGRIAELVEASGR